MQGDLPTIDPGIIGAALRPFEDAAVDIATLGVEIVRDEEKTNPNVVKIVGSPLSATRLRALYFTRATAPWGEGPLYHHIGLYAYRRAALERFVALKPSPLERRERLEQLRALEAGMRIDAEIVQSRAARRRHAGRPRTRPNDPFKLRHFRPRHGMPEKTNRISFQGEPGANSDTACRNMFPAMEPLPCPTFEDAFNAVETGKADLAMIPIENTIAGRVADIHHLLPESKLHIVGEYFLPIHFQLMVLPGVKRDEIKTVHSHIHALGQCRKYIRKNGWKPIDRRRHGGRRQAGRRGQGPHHGGACAARWPRASTGSTSSRRMSRTPTATSPASSC